MSQLTVRSLAKHMINHRKRLKHATKPGYGMGMGRNTLIHKGKKP